MITQFIKCAHPQCNLQGENKVRLPALYGWHIKKYCRFHYRYGLDLKESETQRIFPDGNIEFLDLFTNQSVRREITRTVYTKVKSDAERQIQTVSTRTIVYRRDGYKCLSCGSQKELTLDHIVPKSIGGTNHKNNLQTLCKPCNQKKGDRIRDYRELTAPAPAAQ